MRPRLIVDDSDEPLQRGQAHARRAVMIRRIIVADSGRISEADEHWLDLDGLSEVDATSETTVRPIESALLLRPQSESGWRSCRTRTTNCAYSL